MRSVPEVLADLAAATEAKQGNKIGKLRVELIDTLMPYYESRQGVTSSTPGDLPRVEAPSLDFISDADVFQTDEWKFIQGCCSELELDLTKGVTTGLTKKIFNQVEAKVRAWRVMRRIIEAIGVGGDWPQFAAMGIDETYGKPKHDHSIFSGKYIPYYKPEPDKPAEEPQPEEAPLTTAGGMPVHDVTKPSPAEVMGMGVAGPVGVIPPTPVDIAAGVLSEIASRPEPERKPDKATVTADVETVASNA